MGHKRILFLCFLPDGHPDLRDGDHLLPLQRNRKRKDGVFSTAMLSIVLTSTAFLLLSNIFAGQLASWMEYPLHKEYVIWLPGSLDSMRFHPFLLPGSGHKTELRDSLPSSWSHCDQRFTYLIFCSFARIYTATILESCMITGSSDLYTGVIGPSNMCSSPTCWQAFSLLCCWRRRYSGWSLNFTLHCGERCWFIPGHSFCRDGRYCEWDIWPFTAEISLTSWHLRSPGGFTALYKISILMTLFVQAYRFAAEPFFFAQAKEKDAKLVYARIMDFFILTVSFISCLPCFTWMTFS